jgi:hypothetical protein
MRAHSPSETDGPTTLSLQVVGEDLHDRQHSAALCIESIAQRYAMTVAGRYVISVCA